MSAEVSTEATTGKKRGRADEQEELEIDLKAAEPPSKKALRKAKRQKVVTSQHQSGKETSLDDLAVKQDETKEAVSSSTKRSAYGIWIGNLLYTTTKDDLMTFITSDTDHPILKDKVTRVHLPSGPAKAGKPQNKGFAYIDFADPGTLTRALELSEKLFQGRRVLIKDAKSFEGRPSSTAKDDIANGKQPSRRIFVGNLAFDTTSDDLKNHFSACGAVSKLQVAQFEDSGKCKGYAWIEFEQLSSAESAKRGWVEQGQEHSVKRSKKRIWLHQMNGRKLRVEFAEDPTTRYNKRFGKDAKNDSQAVGIRKQGAVEDGVEYTEDGIQLGEVDEPKPPIKQRKTRPSNAKKQGPYDDQTVKRLTGAITESQGKKVVFD